MSKRTANEGLRLAQAHFNRMVLAGTTPTATEIAALSTLMVALDGIGLAKFHLFYPFIGSVAATHALDVLGSFDITWNGTITHNSSGVKGNGSTGYGNTGYNPSTQSSTTNAHMGFYAADGTHVASSSAAMGAGGGAAGFGSMFTHGWFDGGTREIFAFNVQNSGQYCPTTTETKHDGHLMATVTTSSVQQRHQDGAAVSSGPTATGAGNYYNGSMFVCARNDGSDTAHDDRILKAVHVGDYLTTEESTTLFNAIHAFQTTLGRQDV